MIFRYHQWRFLKITIWCFGGKEGQLYFGYGIYSKVSFKVTLTNSITNINKLDSNAHLSLFSNG